MKQNATLANEFVARYKQLRADGKTHNIALQLTEDDFSKKIDSHCTNAPTFFFNDLSCCDYLDHIEEWQIFGAI